jgi:hypothetical protein
MSLPRETPIVSQTLHVLDLETFCLDIFDNDKEYGTSSQKKIHPYEFRLSPLVQLNKLPFSDISPREFKELLKWGKTRYGVNTNDAREPKRKHENEDLILQTTQPVPPLKITKRSLKKIKIKLQF